MTFSFPHPDPLALSGQAIRIPVQMGSGNEGTLNVLFDDSGFARFSEEELTLVWEGPLPGWGKRVRVGEAVLALATAPDGRNTLSERMPATPPGDDELYAVANGLVRQAEDLRPSGYIVRVTLWLENRSNRVMQLTLGSTPTPVSGKLLDAQPTEALRYVSSDTLLPQGYAPSLYWTRNLACIHNGQAFAFYRDVVFSLRALFEDAAKAGVTSFDLGNSYRSAVWQKQLFDRRLTLSKADPTIADPLAATLRRVTRPNGSEHQTGMALDLFSKTTRELAFGGTPQYAWLKDNAWRYGLVVRYPEEAEPLTGVMFEPWHLRWLGRPLAAWLYRENTVFEAFVAQARQQGAVWLGSTQAALAETGPGAAGESMAASRLKSAAAAEGGDPPNASPDVLWLAVAASFDAVYASANTAYAPVISHFLPDRQVWLIPMGPGSIPAP